MRGIEWCIQQKSKARGSETQIINLSLGGSYSEASNEIANRAFQSGMLVVVAAGNSYTDACEISPASAQQALTIGATDQNDKLASFSNYGNCVKLFAPGVQCNYASASGYGFTTGSGTSFASPLVAGVAASYLSENRSLTASALHQLMISRSKLNAVKSLPQGTPNRFVNPLCQ
ncbi:alkaline serine exoprotease A precursor-like protein [Leptotrombidium deliense]|uniref:Alkaline serine exoprotease A-like protein n=1 Tax=Leptotrombidium deliense TaxID=299467 RepID=A0A443S1J7_9ACAR|nr:alkaline serine exoprotease A precursor-like protein [Leptotrombidium deliense]